MTTYVGPIRRVDTAKSHHYVDANDRRVPGVTTVLGGGLPKPALINWAGNATAEYAIDNWATLSELSPSARLKKLQGARYEDRDAAANRGTEVHALAERLVKGEEVDVPDELAGHIESYIHFLDEHDVRPVLVESTVYSIKHGHAGTLDSILDFPNGLRGFTQPAPRILADIKGLALDTLLPTPTGWTTTGAIQAGEQVFAADGSVCHVVGKSAVRLRDCYRIRFDDGTSIVCDGDHRWPVLSGRNAGRQRIKAQVLTTREIASTVTLYGQAQHRVPNAGPLSLPDTDLPIHPYVYGAWLGDGSKNGGGITKPDNELFDLIHACGYDIGPDISARDRCQTRTIVGLNTQLRLAGLRGHKHVPDNYLRASIDQRIALVRGLMDTDGTYNRPRRQVMFCSTDKALASALRELVLSLGERPVIHEVTGTGFGQFVTSWRVSWRPQRFVPFSLYRKACLVSLAPAIKSTRRLITDVDPTVTVPTQCIAVDSPDHTYLCGEQMVPTHNTNRSGVFGDTAYQIAAYRYSEFILGDDGSERPMIPVDGCAVIHVRADGFALVPITAGPAQYRKFLYIAEVHRASEESRELVGSPVPLPSRVQRRRLEIVSNEVTG